MIASIERGTFATTLSGTCIESGQCVREGLPDADWSRAELEDRADWEVRRLQRRKHCGPIYWWLGKVLMRVRPEFKYRGDWTAWRKRHEIDRTMAQRSMFFARAFDSPDELAGLAIRRADRLARERLGLSEPPSKEEERIRRRLRQLVSKTLPDCILDLSAVRDAGSLVPLIEEVGELFGQLFDAARRGDRGQRQSITDMERPS